MIPASCAASSAEPASRSHLSAFSTGIAPPAAITSATDPRISSMTMKERPSNSPTS
jgi:hypothetical protein